MSSSEQTEKVRMDQLVKILQKNDSAGVQFFETRQKLLDQGYTESEIINGVYLFPYDGEPNKIAFRDPITSFYEKHPEAGDETARNLLNDLAERERQKLVVNSLASEVGDIQSRSYYEVQVADQIGFPYFTVFFIMIALAIAGFKYHLLSSLVGIFGFGASIYFGFLWFQHWRSTRNKK